MTDQKKGVFFYYQLPLAMMFTAQLAVAMLLIFDRSITLLQGTTLITLALFCVFLRKLTRTMIRKQARLISATELSIAVMLERKGKMDEDIYTKLVRNNFDKHQFKCFVSANIDIDKIAKDKNLQTHSDLIRFYITSLAQIKNM